MPPTDALHQPDSELFWHGCLVPGDSPEVSVITIGHSVRHELERSLPALERHAGVPIEVFYVDNASTDGTVEWLKRDHSHVQVVELDQNIWCAARNYAIPRARGRYTMFIDSDALLTADALPEMVKAMDEHPSWGLIGPRLVYPDGTLQLSCRRFPPRLLPLARRPPLARWFEDSDVVRRHLMADDDHSRTRPVLYMLGACVVFRTAAGQGLGPLDRIIAMGGCDDQDWGPRWWKVGLEVVYFPRATVIHDYRRMSARNPLSQAAWRHLRAFVRVQRKYRRQRGQLIGLQDRLDRMALSANGG